MELITRNQYMKRFGIGYPKLQEMIAKKEVDYLPLLTEYELMKIL